MHLFTLKDMQLELLPEMAIHIPQEKTLLLADLHLGKVNHFRRSGIPVPTKTNEKNIDRLIGLLQIATKDIRKKTERDSYEIYLAKKICIRKFVLRVLKNASKSIENMSNMVFLVYLVVFSNSADYSKDYFDLIAPPPK